MPQYHFTSYGHKIQISLADDGLEVLHDGQVVNDFRNPSYLKNGGFRVVEDGEQCNYEWTIQSNNFFSRSLTHTIRRNGEVVLEVEVETP